MALVVGLLVGVAATYAVTASQISSLQQSLSSASASNMMLHDEMQNGTLGLALQAQQGQMFHQGWVFVSSIGGGDYAISVHAEGLESSPGSDYIIEGVTRGSTMQMVPISGNATTSEFEASSNGVGSYWTVIMQNPSSSYEAIDLVYLPGMSMSNATLVASAQLG